MKNFYLRKFTSITTALAMIFSNFTVGFAASEQNKNTQDPVEYHFSQDADYYEKLKNGDGDSTYNPKAKTTIKFGQSGSPIQYVGDSKGNYFKFPKKVVIGTGQEAFCIDHKKTAPSSSGVSYSKYGQLDNGLAYIMAYNPNTGDAKKDYYIKQGAIHYYHGEAQWISNPTIGKDIAEKIVALAKEAVNHKNNPIKNEISVSNKSLTFSPSGEYYETPYVDVNYTGDLTEYTLSINGGLSGVQVIDQDGKVVSTPLSKTNKKIKLRVPKANVTGSHKVSLLVQGKFKVKIAEGYSTSNSKLQRMAILTEELVTANTDLTATVNGIGSLSIIKQDENGNKLKGAQFKLQQNGKDVSDVKTSDANGLVKFENIPLGTYQLIEVSAPQGYVISTPSQNVNVTSDNSQVTVVNHKAKGTVRVLKVDSKTNAPLQGAVFELRDASGKKIETLTTDKNGVATSSPQEFGEYSVVEIQAPEGYLLSSETHKVTISTNNVSVQVTATNEKIQGKIAIEKTDKDFPNIKLSGVEFTIFNKDGQIVEKIVTNDKGMAESGLLDYGKYTIKETKKPEGYKLLKDSLTVDIKENKKTYKLDVKNEAIEGKIQIIKIDSQKKDSRVEGAGFDIIAENVSGIEKGTVVEHIVTDKDGLATTKPLRYGTYKIIETKTPVGYWDSDLEYLVDVHEDEQIYVREITNDPIQAKLRIIKTDGTTKQKLEGVRFKIVNKDTGEDVSFKIKEDDKEVDKTIFETDSNGEILLPEHLRFGTYTIVEVEPKEGYILAEPIDITIDKNTQMEDIEAVGTVTNQWIENQRITGSMELLKIDNETKKPLANVEFKVECIEGFEKGANYKVVSGEDGKAVLENIPYGKYSITEVTPITGYALNTKPIEFEIKTNGEKVELTMENQLIQGEIEIIKVDSKTNAKLEGVEFVILDSEGKEVAKLVTDKDGIAKSEKLPFGFYQIKETKPAEGYLISDKTFEVNIDSHNKVYTQTITNDKIPAELNKIEVLKVNANTKKALEGVEFQLLDENKKVLDTKVTNKDGIILFENLKPGTYYLKESKGLEGYILITDLMKITVTEDQPILKVTVENQPKLAQTGGNFNFNNMILIGALAVMSAAIVLELEKRKNQ